MGTFATFKFHEDDIKKTIDHLNELHATGWNLQEILCLGGMAIAKLLTPEHMVPLGAGDGSGFEENLAQVTSMIRSFNELLYPAKGN